MIIRNVFSAVLVCLVLQGCASTKTASYHYTQKQIEKGDLDFENRLRVDEYVNDFPQGDLAKPKGKDDLAVQVEYFTETLRKNGITTLAQIAVRAREANAVEKAKPLGLTVVLDVSGSMLDDNKFRDSVDALLAMLNELPEGARFALISFSDAAEVFVPATVVNQETRAKLKERVRQLVAGGGTNIEAGLVLGYKTLAAFPKEDTTRLLLLTDGQSTVGVTEPAEIAAKAGVQYQEELRISTVGLGHEVDEQLLRLIASKGKGNYSFAENSSALKSLFMKDLRSLITPIARDVKLTIQPAAGTVLKRVYGFDEQVTQNSFTDDIGELNSDDWRVYIVEVESLPASEARTTLSATVSYSSMKKADQQRTAVKSLGASSKKPVVNKTVARNAVIFANALALIQVSRFDKQGEYSEADRVLTVQRANLEALRKWDQSPELTRESENLAKAHAIVREKLSAQDRPGLKPVSTEAAGGTLWKDAIDVVGKSLPGPWSLVFGLLRLVTE